MSILFTSDTHFGHRRLAELRDFGSTDDMDEFLIVTWNSHVKPDDQIWHVGDLSFYGHNRTIDIVRRLNGRKHWVLGNHDKSIAKNAELRAMFESVEHMAEIKVPDNDAPSGHQRIVLCHFPLLTWNRAHYGSWMLHGHSHGTLIYPHPEARILDVGSDPMGLKPIRYEAVKDIMAHRRYVAVDQHQEKLVGTTNA